MILGTKLKNPVIWTNYYWLLIYFLHIQEQYDIISTAEIYLTMTVLRTSVLNKPKTTFWFIHSTE